MLHGSAGKSICESAGKDEILVVLQWGGTDSTRTMKVGMENLEDGADSYLIKPFLLRQFIEILRDCSRRRKLGVSGMQAWIPPR